MQCKNLPSYVTKFLALECNIIFLVQRNPILYDISHVSFFDSEAKRAVWERIGREVGRCRNCCKRIWKNMIIGYNYRERFRDLGVECPYSKMMRFLDEFTYMFTFLAVECKLILLVRNNPVLFDTNHELFHDSEAQTAAWVRIGEELGETETGCKEKWERLQSCYIERKGKGWPYWKAMTFLHKLQRKEKKETREQN